MSLKEHMRLSGHDDLKCFNKANFYVMELGGHEALKSLRDSQDVVVLDYQWYEAIDVRKFRCFIS